MTELTPEAHMALVVAQVERVFEIVGMYVACGFHQATEEEADTDAASTMLKMIGYQDGDPAEITALIGAKVLVSFYGIVRELIGEELGDAVWQMFITLNAEHRAIIAIEGGAA